MEAPQAFPDAASGLELSRLDGVRGTRRLFTDLTVTVPAGHLFRVRGSNGSGKTTLLRMLCGLVSPERGEVRWRGRPIKASREDFHSQLAYLGHAAALKDELSALENLRSACALAGIDCRPADACSALAQAGLRGREHLPARSLSQGQRKRAALARLALSGTAPLWVLDEPFDALDDSACAWLERLLDAQLARGGVVVLTSHQRRPWEASRPQRALDLDAARAAASPTAAEPAPR